MILYHLVMEKAEYVSLVVLKIKLTKKEKKKAKKIVKATIHIMIFRNMTN